MGGHDNHGPAHSMTLRLTANEVRALFGFLAVTLNDPDTLASSGIAAVEQGRVHAALDHLTALYSSLPAVTR